jgi:hypothetical protein
LVYVVAGQELRDPRPEGVAAFQRLHRGPARVHLRLQALERLRLALELRDDLGQLRVARRQGRQALHLLLHLRGQGRQLRLHRRLALRQLLLSGRCCHFGQRQRRRCVVVVVATLPAVSTAAAVAVTGSGGVFSGGFPCCGRRRGSAAVAQALGRSHGRLERRLRRQRERCACVLQPCRNLPQLGLQTQRRRHVG